MASMRWSLRGGHRSFADLIAPLGAGRSSLLQHAKLIWLMGIVVLLPLDFVKLPFNTVPVDYWLLMALPVVWLFFGKKVQSLSLLYMVAMWLILIASFISTFAAPAPMNSLIVILKEVYVLIWFVTIAAVVSTVSDENRHRLLIVWSCAAAVHGAIIVAQFFSPAFWQLTTSMIGRVRGYDIYRPAGLFLNANSAALFQLLAFVPLMLSSPSPRAAVVRGVLYLPSMLATGSMGAALACFAGATVALIALSLSGHMTRVLSSALQLLLVVALLAGVLFYVTSQNERYRVHFERIFLGRAERSSGSRFSLWERGMDVFIDHGVFIWGVGPENFREVDGKGNQLHSDFIAFLVERGIMGLFGLVMFAGVATSRAIALIWMYNKRPPRAGPEGFVFLAAIVATLVE